MYTAPAKGGVFLSHFTVWSARACFKETKGDVYSQQSQTASHSSKARGRNVLSFFKKAREGKKITAKDTVEFVRDACRTTYWKRLSAEGFYQLQTFFRIEQPGILGCAPCGRVIASRRFEGTHRLIFRVICPWILSHSSAISHKPRTNASEWALEKSMCAHSNQGCWFWNRSDC